MKQQRLAPIEIEIATRLNGESFDVALDEMVEARRVASGSLGIPVNLERIAKYLGVTRVVYQSLPCDGVLIPTGSDSYEARISSSASSTRQRFSLAHELAHAMIHDLVPETRSFAQRNVFLQPGIEAEERLCDKIAARILMPRQCIEKAVEKYDLLDVRAVRQLAARFDVSLSAIAVRLKEVLGVDFAIILAKKSNTLGTVQISRVISNFRRHRLEISSGELLRGNGQFSLDLNAQVGTGLAWIGNQFWRRHLFVNWVPTRSVDSKQWLMLFSKHQLCSTSILPQGEQ